MAKVIDLKYFPEYRGLTTDGCSNVVFDINTCKLFEIDDNGFRVLHALSRNAEKQVDPSEVLGGSEEEVRDAEVKLRGLIESRVLQVRDTEFIQRREIKDVAFSYVILNVSHECQLSCKYCFASGGTWGMNNECTMMDFATAKRSIDLIARTRGQNPANISFFGGEPLLNWRVVKETVEYSDALFMDESGVPQAKYGITTNGIAMTDEIGAFMAQHRFSVMLSIDGDELLHNSLRPAKNPNVDSFAGVASALRILNKHGLRPIARCTMTSEDRNPRRLAQIFCDMGFEEVNIQVVECEQDSPLHISFPGILAYEQEIGNFIANKEDHFCYEARVYGGRLYAASTQDLFCGMGISGVTVAPNGDLYPCHRVVGEETFHMGNVLSGVDTDKAISFLAQHSVDKSPHCMDCWAKHICCGGCYAQNYFVTGNMYVPSPENCHMIKHSLTKTIERILVENKEVAASEVGEN